jgi:hypothetical protein
MRLFVASLIPPDKFRDTTLNKGNLDSAVGIATGYGLNDRGVGVQVPVGSRIFSFPRCPDRLWGPPNLLSNGHGEGVLFSRG